MIETIKRFILFLLPVLRSAALQVTADVIDEAVYGPGPRPYYRRRRPAYTPYNRMATRRYSPSRAMTESFEKKAPFDYDAKYKAAHAEGTFHDVLMVAFDVRGKTELEVHRWLESQMPYGDAFYGDNEDIYLDSWWVANDTRYDGSDCDSAVFVSKGQQRVARELLHSHGLSAEYTQRGSHLDDIRGNDLWTHMVMRHDETNDSLANLVEENRENHPGFTNAALLDMAHLMQHESLDWEPEDGHDNPSDHSATSVEGRLYR